MYAKAYTTEEAALLSDAEVDDEAAALAAMVTTHPASQGRPVKEGAYQGEAMEETKQNPDEEEVVFTGRAPPPTQPVLLPTHQSLAIIEILWPLVNVEGD